MRVFGLGRGQALKELKDEPIVQEAAETFSNSYASHKNEEIAVGSELVVLYSMKTVPSLYVSRAFLYIFFLL